LLWEYIKTTRRSQLTAKRLWVPDGILWEQFGLREIFPRNDIKAGFWNKRRLNTWKKKHSTFGVFCMYLYFFIMLVLVYEQKEFAVTF
jgi:hypothetical protein